MTILILFFAFVWLSFIKEAKSHFEVPTLIAALWPVFIPIVFLCWLGLSIYDTWVHWVNEASVYLKKIWNGK